ncbi:hypothetical protein BDZ45DRAFT_736745 [Acephala macrosclerotiorum]|nr:hypothetical protein BDZ45DRAFT_736745 [Acephala macrosclerotiorum]
MTLYCMKYLSIAGSLKRLHSDQLDWAPPGMGLLVRAGARQGHFMDAVMAMTKGWTQACLCLYLKSVFHTTVKVGAKKKALSKASAYTLIAAKYGTTYGMDLTMNGVLNTSNDYFSSRLGPRQRCSNPRRTSGSSWPNTGSALETVIPGITPKTSPQSPTSAYWPGHGLTLSKIATGIEVKEAETTNGAISTAAVACREPAFLFGGYRLSYLHRQTNRDIPEGRYSFPLAKPFAQASGIDVLSIRRHTLIYVIFNLGTGLAS